MFFYSSSDASCVFFPHVSIKPVLLTEAAESNDNWSAFVLSCSEDTESLLPRLGTAFSPPPAWTEIGGPIADAPEAPLGVDETLLNHAAAGGQPRLRTYSLNQGRSFALLIDRRIFFLKTAV